MKPFKKILVPVDFSAHSDAAVSFASDLSRRYDASLELLQRMAWLVLGNGTEA